MPALPTFFNNIRFRSRIEARWAVFMSAMNIEYQYEPQGFTHRGVSYLPDFWLPQHGVWLEIKGEMPSGDEQCKAAILAEITRHPVFILYGDIPNPPDFTNDSAHLTIPCNAGGTQSDTCYRWSQCLTCGQVTLGFEGNGDRVIPHADGCEGLVGSSPWTPALKAAYEIARSARFEHGERSLLEQFINDRKTVSRTSEPEGSHAHP